MLYTVEFTANEDGSIDYKKGLLRVHRNDSVNFKGNKHFRVTFLDGSPFEITSLTETPGTPKPPDGLPVRDNAEKRAYSYSVVMVDPQRDGTVIIFSDLSCPTIIVE